ncbi:NAD(P)/FAD-dependent oxidoreductase [Streptomyces sp. FH025]|uniref:NAD(P)/FAD-dependent oxidoreductase n=1 Tax=Streptomyces sp. FH025 TaxID=2815937 RepID=UPI001A9F9B75|nr:FAD-dependent oxidoreductase [Streptomyces sp. FH025]MBO1418878.1 FAD-dependent oxidoreductase [Streptomyces sp. FH025]
MSRTVAVVGGGYGGAAVAKALESEAEVVLIDPRDAFANVAGSLRALARPEWAPNMFFPFKTLLTRGRVIQDRAASVDATGVTLASGEHVAADYVVLATGSTYPYPANPSAATVADALEDFRASHQELLRADTVLILGAGPVGLELAGEIKEVWPDKKVTIVDPATELLPGFEPEVVEDLRGQLAALDVEVRLGTGLTAEPGTRPGLAGSFTVTTTAGDEITADVWYRAHGTTTNTDYLADGRLTALDPQGRIPVTEKLNVRGHDHVYAVGDITDVAEAKMAGYAMQHADVVAKNILAQINGQEPTEAYRPLGFPMILLPLGTKGGVGQLPSPEGPFVAPAETVSQYKGQDLFTGRFTATLGPTAG